MIWKDDLFKFINALSGLLNILSASFFITFFAIHLVKNGIHLSNVGFSLTPS